MSRLNVDAKFYADLECVRVFFTTHQANFGSASVLFVNDVESLCTEASVSISPTFYSAVRSRLSFLQQLLFAVVDQNERDRFVHFSEICGKIQMMLNNLQFVEEDEAKKPEPGQRMIQMPNERVNTLVQHVLSYPIWPRSNVKKGFGKRS